MEIFMRAIPLLLLLISTSAQAMPKMYLKSDGAFFPSFYLVKGERAVSYTPGFTNAELTEQFEDNKLAFKEIEKYNSHTNRANLFIWGGLGLALTYLVTTDRDNFSAGTYWGVFGTGLIGGLYYAGKSTRSFYRAINIYNEVPEEMSFKSQNSSTPKLVYSWKF
jgi:hypothetical protein